ncbi:unnamed protein product [Callosobruchus maculatus]|uniref:Uncharacterized protein n=1 Tax=Callosobruchus maculatus TaxID=64391 RepID=A0A653CBE0_CALMS|nr:unnamed protein product [Callosobruchus maculatus]
MCPLASFSLLGQDTSEIQGYGIKKARGTGRVRRITPPEDCRLRFLGYGTASRLQGYLWINFLQSMDSNHSANCLSLDQKFWTKFCPQLVISQTARHRGDRVAWCREWRNWTFHVIATQETFQQPISCFMEVLNKF